jgi:hypothetical protein
MKSLLSKIKLFASAAGFGAAALFFSCGTADKGLIVPLYFVNSTQWEQVANAEVGEYVILNPYNGPGDEQNPLYTNYIGELIDKGKIPIGYIYTKWGSRPLEEVEADIDKWLDFYPDIKGFFIDETATGSDKLDYYKTLVDYIKSKGDYYIVLNPGTQPLDNGYFDIADTVVVYEGTYDNKPQGVCQVNPSKSAVIVYNATEEEMKTVLTTEDCKYYYVTDRTLPNPFDSLPSYFDQEVELLKKINFVLDQQNGAERKGGRTY